MDKRQVTEQDLRQPEFMGCDLDDLEWRDDNTIARKDRWEQGIRDIVGVLGMDPRKGFEIDEVVQRVRDLARK